jgi:hypothetical protein
MAKATLSLAQMATLRSLRNLDEDIAGALRTELFASIKAGFGIPDEHKVKVEIDEEESVAYGVIIRKKTGEDYTLTADGVWDEGKPQPQSAAQAAGKKVKESRWFKVPRAMIANAVVTDGGDFKDGDLAAPEGELIDHDVDGVKFPMVVTDDGDLYIKLDLVEDTDRDDLIARIFAMLAKA